MLKQLKIGSLSLRNNLLLAPMAGITNLPVRLMARELGASLCFTEMVSANGLVRDGQKSFELLQSSSEDRPLGIQIFGDDPMLLAESARLVEGGGDLIDINMGCPVRKVVNGGAGSALMREPARVGEIIRRVKKAVSLPLTIKIRIGWNADEPSFLEIARIAENEGCDAITLHPRCRSQMFGGIADWTKIAELKQYVKIPVIGSGDLFNCMDVAAMLELTGCDGVMIARGSLGYPWIFRESLQLLKGEEPLPPSPEEKLEVSLRHLELFVGLAGERVAVREMRKHLSWYARGIPGAARFRTMVNIIEGREPLTQLLHDFYRGMERAHG
ncbi:MAG TPA: tRNA dihydrouridine synthase DusB [Geobacteraceae bacterium]|nr:tRNA dihydrouridine synthase DusB [Geobacteraceae bacterium]